MKDKYSKLNKIDLNNTSVVILWLLSMYYKYHFMRLSPLSGADPGIQVRGGALKKIGPSGGRREHFWGISCEKSRFDAKKIIFFPIYGGRKLTIPERWQAVGMHNGGFSHRMVADHFRVNHSIIV
jgi:hypothetical protein